MYNFKLFEFWSICNLKYNIILVTTPYITFIDKTEAFNSKPTFKYIKFFLSILKMSKLKINTHKNPDIRNQSSAQENYKLMR